MQKARMTSDTGRQQDVRDIGERTFAFASRIIRLYQHLDRKPGAGRLLGQQVLRAGCTELEKGKNAKGKSTCPLRSLRKILPSGPLILLFGYQYLDRKPGAGRIIGQQILRAGTSIGANIEKAQAGQSKADFISKNAIALSLVRLVTGFACLAQQESCLNCDYRSFRLKIKRSCEFSAQSLSPQKGSSRSIFCLFHFPFCL
jgi:four helix bundle protein